jgi:hypothetical protein
MRSVVFGVGIYDVSTLSAVVATLGVVVLTATILPALKIAKIDPASTLREESCRSARRIGIAAWVVGSGRFD